MSLRAMLMRVSQLSSLMLPIMRPRTRQTAKAEVSKANRVKPYKAHAMQSVYNTAGMRATLPARRKELAAKLAAAV